MRCSRVKLMPSQIEWCGEREKSICARVTIDTIETHSIFIQLLLAYCAFWPSMLECIHVVKTKLMLFDTNSDLFLLKNEAKEFFASQKVSKFFSTLFLPVLFWKIASEWSVFATEYKGFHRFLCYARRFFYVLCYQKTRSLGKWESIGGLSLLFH